VKQYDVEASRWYQKAAEQGDADAQFNLGVRYGCGRGVRQDDVEATRWYRKAAEQGYSDAQLSLGFMYVNGRGVKQDDVQAARWYRKAAEQGLQEAKDALSILPPRVCANCGVMEKAGGIVLKPCGRCKVVVYCGKECQTQHWKTGGQRAECK